MSNIFNMSESRKRNQMCIAFSQTSDGMKNARRKRGTWTVILRSHGGYIKACSYGTAIIAGAYIAWASVHKEQHDSPRHLGIAGQLKAVCTLSETLHPSRRRFFFTHRKLLRAFSSRAAILQRAQKWLYRSFHSVPSPVRFWQ